MPACGLELIHTYSLIHDDLPCMDDDDFRRGRPTNHKVFGEAMAVLAGDALTALAFECLLAEEPTGLFSLTGAQLRAARAVSRAIGTVGLVGGQVMDISNDARDRRKETLEETCGRKTGALIETSLECGGLLAGADSRVLAALRGYGKGLGLGFQIIDDVLNVTGDPKQMGKAAHSDQARDMVTFASLLGVERCQKGSAALDFRRQVRPRFPGGRRLAAARDRRLRAGTGVVARRRSRADWTDSIHSTHSICYSVRPS